MRAILNVSVGNDEQSHKTSVHKPQNLFEKKGGAEALSNRGPFRFTNLNVLPLGPNRLTTDLLVSSSLVFNGTDLLVSSSLVFNGTDLLVSSSLVFNGTDLLVSSSLVFNGTDVAVSSSLAFNGIDVAVFSSLVFNRTDFAGFVNTSV